jgi:hypothetical protein
MSMYPDYSNGSGNPYEFIMNPNTAPKKTPLGTIVPSNNPFIMRIVILVGGAVALMIVLAIGISLFSKGGLNTVPLVGMAQTQAELVRVSTEGTTSAVQQSTKNLAINVELTMMTQQQQTVSFLSKHGRKVAAKELILKKSAQTDLQLTNAKEQSTYDQAFSQIIQASLKTYASSLQQTYNSTTSPSERNLLSTFYAQTQLLLKQTPVQASVSTGS